MYLSLMHIRFSGIADWIISGHMSPMFHSLFGIKFMRADYRAYVSYSSILRHSRSSFCTFLMKM